MIFSLEAMQAFNGDCLLLHGGTAERSATRAHRRRADADLGPSLKPRFEELRGAVARRRPLRIDLAMISHIDDDHVAGMVAFTAYLISQRARRRPSSSPDAVAQQLRRHHRQHRRGAPQAALAGLAVPAGDRARMRGGAGGRRQRGQRPHAARECRDARLGRSTSGSDKLVRCPRTAPARSSSGR